MAAGKQIFLLVKRVISAENGMKSRDDFLLCAVVNGVFNKFIREIVEV